MNRVYKKMNGVDMCFAENVYERLFHHVMFIRVNDNETKVGLTNFDKQFLVKEPMVKLVEMANNLDEKLISLIVKNTNLSVMSLIK